jgi:esterase/lipase superfamily enzyme
VSIPPTHRRGQLERPFSLWKIQFKENVERHIVITSCNCLSIGDWKGNAIDKLAEMESKSALVFIHGFNVSFDDAIRQAAQIGFDLQLQSLITAYSWASQGAVSNYAADEDSVKLTVPNFIDFLNTLTSIGITTIHVIAHSMGNRALVEALENFPDIASSLGEVVMAAPDIDATLFRKSVSELHGKAKRYTLYGSASDRAIKLSKTVHAGYPRAGDGDKDILVMNGIETIDATKVGEDLFGFGHSYFSDKPRVLSDLYYLIRESLPASRREGLCEEKLGNLRYWILA